MNNKGFAITGIIYTLFILFLMILLSILSGLSTTQRLMITSTESLEESLKGIKVDITEAEDEIAPYSGKYIFEVKVTNADNSINTFMCSTYLNKGTNFKNKNDINFITKDCNEYDYDTGTNDIQLVKIYSFEEVD